MEEEPSPLIDFQCPDIFNIKADGILSFFLDMDLASLQKGVKPSQLHEAFRLSTEERLAKLKSPLRKYKVGTKKDPFIRCPEAVIFQNFKVGEIYTTTLSITNQRSVSQNLKVCFESSRYFTLSTDKKCNSSMHFTPGMTNTFIITFIPSNYERDFLHNIHFFTQESNFTVPIFALGQRPMVVIPDKLVLPPTLVKVESLLTLTIRNSGSMSLKYFQEIDEPFSCNILKAVVPPNGILEIRYSCYYVKEGHVRGIAKIHFKNDFYVVIDLECDIKIVPIKLNNRLITFGDICMSLCRRETLTLHNASDYCLNFAWKNDDIDKEKHEMYKLVDLLEKLKEYEQKRCEKLEYFDIIDVEGHRKIYERIFHDECYNLVKNVLFLYNSDYFQIVPKVGKILPKSTFQFSIIFSPKQSISYYSSAYLDIEGSSQRYRVAFQGYGIGPPVMLIVKTINAGQIYLTDKHQYEISVTNKGIIPATVTYQSKNTDFGGVIKCIPHSITLGTDTTKAFVIIFQTEVEGKFLETLDFKVEESEEILQCIFSGNVICPLLKCIPETIDFGTVSIGISSTKELSLINEFRVPITFNFQIESSPDKITKNDCLLVTPNSGKVLPISTIVVKVTFCSDVMLDLNCNLLLIMWKNNSTVKTIPIRSICACPRISCEPKMINIKFCFLNCDYFRTIKLTNKSHCSGYVEYIPIDNKDETIECTPSEQRLYFESQQTLSLELKIRLLKMGSHKFPLNFSVIGGKSYTLCSVNCTGQGPVVSYFPDEIHFGKIEVLKRMEKKLTLVNDSPISAKVNLCFKHEEVFHIDEIDRYFELSPEESREVTIWVLLTNPNKNKDKIYLELYQGGVFRIPVSADGDGTSILCNPPLTPSLNFGILLTYKVFCHEVNISNKGSYRHRMLFTKRNNVRTLKETEEGLISSIFNIEPCYLELESNEDAVITIRCVTKNPKKVVEKYFCHATIGKSTRIDTIMNFTLEAEFVDPKLIFSQRKVNFNLEVLGKKVDGKTKEIIQVHNKTGIPLNIDIKMDGNEDHFNLIDENDSTSKAAHNLHQQSLLSVQFNPTIKEKRKQTQSARLIVEYEDHPKTEVINLHGEVMFPTIKLYPDDINFHCVPLGSTSYKTIILQNISAMAVNFKWFWQDKSLQMNDLDPNGKQSERIKIVDNCCDKFMEYVEFKEMDQNRDIYNIKNYLTSDKFMSMEEMKIHYDSAKYLEGMKNVLSAVLAPFKSSKSFPQLEILSKRKNLNLDPRIEKMLSLVPSEGTLKPNEYTIVTIGFNPPLNTEIRVKAICKVQDGAEELLLVTGRSSKLVYELDKSSINLGNQVFCERCSDKLTLTNTGLCTFDFKIYFNEIQSLHSIVMEVSPELGSVGPKEEVVFKIECVPGYPGYFCESITLEVGYLDHIKIDVHGHAVLSQIFMNIPRSDLSLSIEDDYKAIAWITPDYLESIQLKDKSVIDDWPDDPRKFLEENDWTYISRNGFYPSLIDINMAKERIVAFNLIEANPKLLKDHTVRKKIPHIPQFYPTPYLVNFGYVVQDIPLCYTVIIFNYGPINADVKLMEDNKTALLEKDIKIEFKNKILRLGESVELYVIFAPTRRKYGELNKKIEDKFRLMVKHGPVITVQIKAEVTFPKVCLEREELIFQGVYCGEVLRKTIILHNHGYVKSKWFATIIKPTRQEGRTEFLVYPNQGELDAGMKTHLNVFFVPWDTKKLKRTLRIDVESNAEPIFLFLYGEGLEAELKLAPSQLNFGPTLSYFEETMQFAVQNMAEIPLQFYFSAFDTDSEHEKHKIQVYLKLKNVTHVFIPLRSAGQSLPNFFTSTYECLLEKLREKIIKENEVNIVEIEDDDQMIETKQEEKSAKIEDPLLKYTRKEQISLLHDFMLGEDFETGDYATNGTLYKLEDSSQHIEIVEPETKISPGDTERNAVFFIFHGAPNTDVYRAANLTGIALSMPVYSIDRLIIEVLVEKSHPIASHILQEIDNEISSRLNFTITSLLENLELEDSEYEKILEKINIIRTTKVHKRSKKTEAKDKESKGSSEKSQGRNKEHNESHNTFLNISLDVFVDVLKAKMKNFSCLIIESLNNTFIHQANDTLYTLLRAMGPVEYINLIIFSFTIRDYIKNHEVAKPISASKEKLVKKTAEKFTKGNAKTGSDKASKKSKSSAKADQTKKIFQHLNKSVKLQMEEFEKLRHEILHIVQYWDKKSSSLRKLYGFSNKKDISNVKDAKDSVRTTKNSTKKPISTQNLFEELQEQDLYLWMVLNSSKERNIDFAEMVSNTIKDDLEIGNILNRKEVFEESETKFSVISKPNFQKENRSEIFTIKDYQSIENNLIIRRRSKSGSSLKIKSKKSSKSSRKSADSRTVVENPTLTFTKGENESEFTPKIILGPGDLVNYQVTFCPEKYGSYKNIYQIQTPQNATVYKLVCNGLCEIPSIDVNPEVLFPKVLENYKEKVFYDHYVFIKDKRIFDFGSLIAASSDKNVQTYRSSIRLINISSSKCQILASLSNDIFTIEPFTFTILPQEEDVLTISVKPQKVGTFTSQLYLSIKNNPKVEVFTLACSLCKLEFNIYPKAINFEKVPVNYTAVRVVRFTNTSPINLRWEFVDCEWASEIFELSQHNGFMGLYSVCEIVFRFKPQEETSFPKRHLSIKVYDVNCLNCEPCFIENLAIQADSIEYNLEVEDHLDYGEIKTGVDYKRHFAILNKGKCEIALKIELINNPLELHNFVREYVKIQPLTLTVTAQKSEHLSIIFHPKSRFIVNYMLIFVISMVESLQTEHVVKTYKVHMSAACFMPEYLLCPQSRLSFGYVPLLQSHKLKLEMTNKGRFSFSFVLLNYAKVLEGQQKKDKKKGGKKSKKSNSGKSSQHSKNSRKSKRSAKNKKSEINTKSDKHKKSEQDKKSGKNKKSEKNNKDKRSDQKTKSKKSEKSSNKADRKKLMKITKLHLHPFMIVPSSGIISPGETFLIDVEVTPQIPQEFKEKILVKITEIEEIHKNNVLTLTATGCEPQLNFKDLDSVFSEHYLVAAIEDFIPPKNIDSCTAFSSSDTTLCFKRVCINRSKSARLIFKNVGFVTAYLTARIDDGGKNVFFVVPTFKNIEPHSSDYMEILFKPNSLYTVNATLELSYNTSIDNKLTVQLQGEACLPQIILLSPIQDDREMAFNIGPLCVGFSKSFRLSFQNVGEIKCKVMVEMSPREADLSLVPIGKTMEMLNAQKNECLENIKYNLMMNLFVGEIGNIDLVFNPSKSEIIQTTLCIHSIGNPYEVIKLKFNVESFDNDVILKGLEPVKFVSLNHTHGIVCKNSVGYNLDFGQKQLNKLYKQSISITNRSKNNMYKFKFYSLSVLFIPEVGHLKPDSSKEVLVIFKTAAPLILNNDLINCHLDKIKYITPIEENTLSWDDRQKFTYWISNFTSIYTAEDFTSSIGANLEKGELTISEKKSLSNFATSNVDDEEQEIPPVVATKVIMEGMEPEVIIVSDTFEVIPILLSVTADYAKYECDITQIEFEGVFVRGHAQKDFLVKNIGSVKMVIKWMIEEINPYEINIKKSSSQSNLSSVVNLRDNKLRSASSSSLSSTNSIRTYNSLLPLKIQPEFSVIEPGTEANFSLIFSPRDLCDLHAILKSYIEALDPNSNEIAIDVSATALPIPFYFEMEDGSTSLEDSVVLEFETVGIATESTEKLILVNPSEDLITFQISQQDKSEFSYFVCNNTLEGSINKGKKSFCLFTFRPQILGSFEKTYILTMPEKNLQKFILLRGLCREPNVYFSENVISMKPTVPSVKVVRNVTLRNEEVFSISFKFLKKSQISMENQQEKLEIHPIVGQIKPRSEFELRLTFTSPNLVSAKFHLKCFITRMKTPLSLHVSACCLKIQPLVSFINVKGETMYLKEDYDNIIDMGLTIKGRKEILQFKIRNQGQTGMFYSWDLDAKPVAHLFKFCVDTEKVFVKSGDAVTTNFGIESIRVGALKQFKVNLNFMYGTNFKIFLNISSEISTCSFSFHEYDFGCCLVQDGATSYYSKTLSIKNVDTKKILIQNLFEKADYLAIDFSSKLLAPGEVRNVNIKFYPQKEGQYKEEVQFLIAGLKHLVMIKGEAVKIQLKPCNSKDKFINLGEVLVNSTKKHRLAVCNNSAANLEVRFDFYDNLKVHSRKIGKIERKAMKLPVLPPPPKEITKKKKGKEDGKKENRSKEGKSRSDKKSEKDMKSKKPEPDKQTEINFRIADEEIKRQAAERRQLFLKNFQIIPNDFINIPPRGKSYFDIIFQPLTKITFEEKIYFEIQDQFEPFCVIKGSSIVPEFSLDRKELQYLRVIVGCNTSQFVTLRNTGDIIGSFNWKIDPKSNVFSIEPKQGFVLPKNDIKIKINFEPKYEKCQFKSKAKCFIKELKKPLELTIKGNSIKMPEPIETITLKCLVREKIVDHSVSITNSTPETWLVNVELSHEAFSAPKEVNVSPNKSVQIPITYTPKKMTLSSPDQATLFIKTPDGNCLLYNLRGVAEPPLVKKKIEKEIRCKQNHFEKISLENWLAINQTFNVTTEVTSPLSLKTLYRIFGFRTIELNRMETKTYKWGVYVVNEGPIDFRVTFKNPLSGEYEFFEFSFKVTPSEAIEIIHFDARVRETIIKQVTLENPINVPVNYLLECSEKHLMLPKMTKLEPYTTAKVDLSYTPLTTESTSTTLNAKCEELGTYTFLLKFKPRAPKEEERVTFSCELGGRAKKAVSFKNTFNKAIEFSYKFDNKEFSMERCPLIAPGDSGKILIAFEPFNVGRLSTKLFLTSSVSGEYIYPLEGIGVLPTPKGPFTVKLTYPTTIDFKNPYVEDKRFQLNLQPDKVFYCDFNDEDVIKARRTIRIQIYVHPEVSEAGKCPVTGKLVIYSEDLPDIQWKYYLEYNG
ncbi:hypothetical protein ABEB36_008047 [Hypothenemus hampei]|uniref:Hydrocephalus-inducing protein homolog n=1 Tax=Hypothenemus hampei TaxID=57062 RepID=A0ABD1EKY8_HYPHA